MYKAIDDLRFVNESGKKDLRQIAQELAVGRVVLFAGAGLSFNAPRRDGGRNNMPSWRSLSAALLERMEGQIRDPQDPLKVADYFETKFGRPALIDAIVETIRDAEHMPGRVHQQITSLNFEEIITTNFDTLIERAFERQFILPQVIVESRDLVRKRKPPRVIKMNGCLKNNPSGVVITGNDFLSYGERHPLIEVLVINSFVESTVLFIGFGLDDPAFQAINERVLSTLGRQECRFSYSLQFGASETEVKFWANRRVQLIDLKTDQPAGLSEEERLNEVLQALLAAQRERSRPHPQLRTKLLSSPAPECHLTEPEIDDWRRALGVLAPKLREEELTGLLRGRGDLLGLLRKCRQRALDGRNEGQAAPALLVRTLLSWLKEICRFEDIRSPGLLLEKESWAPVAQLVDLLASSGFKADGSTLGESDLASNLRVLSALLCLKLLIVSPHFSRSGIACLGKARAAERFLAAIESLELTGLFTGDMLIRSRFLTLLCFFGPLKNVVDLLDCWEEQRDESELRDGGKLPRQPTPEEYRAPLLSFYGLPLHQRLFYQRAAESLWSRQMFGDEGSWRVESAFRYRHLRQAAPDRLVEWNGVRLHHERLERVLGRLSLEPKPTPQRETDVCHELLAFLLELHRGWLFGCPTPGALSRAWELAEETLARRRGDEVPWEALLLLTLPVEGLKLWERWAPLVTSAWKEGHLDMDFLIRATVLRIRGWNARHLSQERPIARYETGLSYLVLRLVVRTCCEAQESPLRKSRRVLELLEPIGAWLQCTEEPQVRDNLLDALAHLRQLYPEQARPVIRDWIDSQLKAPRGGGRLGLALLDPLQSELLVNVDQIQILLAHAQSRSGESFKTDVLKWLADWSEAPALAPMLVPLARQISGSLQPPPVAHGNFDWLHFAAQVRARQSLLKEVEKVLREDDPGTPTLYAFVKRALLGLTGEGRHHWRKKDSFLGTLAPFAPDLDDDFAAFLDPWLEPGEVTDSGLDGAAALLAALLSRAPEPVLLAHRERWLADLRELVRRGATGHGALGDQVLALGEPATQAFQDNLLALLERRRRVRHREVVSWVEGAIRDGSALPLADLEEQLVESIESDDPDLALLALESAVALARDDPRFLARNHGRLRRVRLSAERRRAFRPHSRFAELLGVLARLPESRVPM